MVICCKRLGNMCRKTILSVVFLMFAYQDSVFCLNVVFGPGSTDTKGSIEVLVNDGRLLPICYRGDDYRRESVVFCHQMGFKGGFPLYIPNGPNVTTAFLMIHCPNGSERSISECDVEEHPYTEDCGTHIIGASCFNTTGARLLGTTQPNIGRLQVEYNDVWADVCFVGDIETDREWDFANLKVLCRQLGYPGSMQSQSISFHYPTGSTFADDFKCITLPPTDTLLLQDCLSDNLKKQSCSVGVLASCAAPGYIGCVLDDKVDHLLPDYENEDDDYPWFSDKDMTIHGCIDACRNYDMSMQFAGLSLGNRCFCGTTDRYIRLSTSFTVDDSDCKYTCMGNSNEICGGPGKLSVYNISAAYCQDPGQPVNGRHDVTEFPFGSIVTFTCFLGYELVGLQSIQCVIMSGINGPAWNGTVPKCEAQPTKSAPTRPETTTNGNSPKGLAGNDSEFPIGIVAGAAGGGLVVLVMLIAMIFFVTRKKKHTPCKSQEQDANHSNMNGKSPSTVRYSNVPDERLNGSAGKISTLTRKNDNFVEDKTHAYEQPPPQDVYDYAELPQETYEEVAQQEYSDIAPEEPYADVSQKDYSEIAINDAAINKDSPDTSSKTRLGVKKPSFPPYAKIDKDQKNKRQSEHLYNYAEVEVPASESADEQYADVEIPMLDGKHNETTGNTSEKADSEEGWAECIIYDDYDDDGAVVPTANQGYQERKNGWVENDIYNT